MKPSRLFALLLLCFVLWIVSKNADEWVRSWGSYSLIAEGLPRINAVLLPLGIFLSLQALMTGGKAGYGKGATLQTSHPENSVGVHVDDTNWRRHTGWLAIGFVILYAFFLGSFLLAIFISRMSSERWENRVVKPDLASLLREHYSAPAGEAHLASAQNIYTLSGTGIPYLAADHSYRLYKPTARDEARWRSTQQTWAQDARNLADMKRQGQRPLNLLIFSFGALILTFLIGTVRLMNAKLPPS